MRSLKFPDDNKEFFEIADKLAQAEHKANIETERRKETLSEREHKCAEIRCSRIQKLVDQEGMSDHEAVSHWRDGITPYELETELLGSLSVPPAERYQIRKKNWENHETSWWKRRNTTTPPLTCYDGYGCSGEHGCIPSCRFYEPTGTITDEEVIKAHEERNKKEKVSE